VQIKGYCLPVSRNEFEKGEEKVLLGIAIRYDYFKLNKKKVKHIILIILIFLVTLVGGNSPNEGNVYARNPNTGIFGPVCDDAWDVMGVSQKICVTN